MKSNLFFRRVPALLLAALLLASCGITPPSAATTMHLRRTEGTVGVSDSGGKDVEPRDDLGLYSGYAVETKRKSFAWIDLDEVKLTKLDEKSEVEIVKEGKALEIEVKSGSLFFNVTEPLADDETMTIRSSTMAVGIRGTCGWVENDGDESSWLFLLEGKVEVGAAGGGSATAVSAGEAAHVFVNGEGETEITVSDFPASAIPGFVLEELDEDLTDTISDDTGSDVPNPSDPNEAAHTAYSQVLAEYQDAHTQGLDQLTEQDIDWDNPPDLSSYQYITASLFTYGWPTHYACHDIDGNGVDELVTIQVRSDTTPSYVFSSHVYAFDGSRPVLLTERLDEYGAPTFFAVLDDGTFAQYVGNGGYIDSVYRLGPDGFTLEIIPDSPYAGTWDSIDYDRTLVHSLEPTPLY